MFAFQFALKFAKSVSKVDVLLFLHVSGFSVLFGSG
jgi:hypothetical protein